MRHPLLTMLLVWACLTLPAYFGLAYSYGAEPEPTTYSALVRLGVAYVDRDDAPEVLEARRRMVQTAIDKAAQTKKERALLIALGWDESKFASFVVEYRCADGPKGQRCDDGKASGPWQGWHMPTRNLESDARLALSRVRQAMNYCGRAATWALTLERALANYATGSKTCEWVVMKDGVKTYPAKDRVALVYRIEGWL